MKYIVKGQEPPEFTEWKALANDNDNWTPTYDDLRSPQKDAVKKALMNEQGHICCYCERRLDESNSHIEHFNPRSRKQVDPLDYSNLLCSCFKKLTKGFPRHCGVLKDNWFDEALLISPLDETCETHFSYTAAGEILPANETDKAARETIERLGLNIAELQAKRQKAVEPFLDSDIENEEFIRFVDGYLKKDECGRFNEFFTTIRYLFNPTRS